MEESDSIKAIEPIASTSNHSITFDESTPSNNIKTTTTQLNNNVIQEVEEVITYPPLPPSIAETIDLDEVIPELPEEEAETNITDGLLVRTRLVSRILSSLNQLSQARTRTLILTTFLAFSQIITFIVILSLSSHSKETCSQPLQLYLILSTIRIGVNFPLSLYINLVPPRPSRRATELERERLRASRRIGSESTDRRIRRLSDLLSLSSLILFILGNYWIFSTSHCEVTAPKLFYTTITALVISYLYAAEIFLIVIAVLFFLPLLLIILRVFGVGEKTNEIGPLSNLEISKLPLRIYIPSPIPLDTSQISPEPQLDGESTLPTSTTEDPPPSPTTTTHTTTKSSSQGPARFWRLFKKRISRTTKTGSKSHSSDGSGSGKGGGEDLSEYYKPPNSTFVILSESQSTCAICLCDYDPPPRLSESPETTYTPEWLRLLPCSHAFHKDCLDSWLKVSGRCPLCQAPAVVKKGGSGGKSSRGARGGGGTGAAEGGGDDALVAAIV